ncbi:MAG TPA: dTDP-glucose 4,6-dehydratase [Gemmatimonadaceae bacterium]|nr:dTDP-glucose 4,6-dehydratase [Gemmatimonadaceae bacterium]
MRRLLVTGGAGFIGGNFVRYWLREHASDRVVVFDALTYAGNLATLAGLDADPRFAFVRGDIAEPEAVARALADHEIDTIVHFAAESHVDRSIVEPGAFVRTNVVGTQVLLDAARAAWRTNSAWRPGVRFHHVSTDEVYGSLGPQDAAFTERTPYSPNSPYAASKAASDHLVRAYQHTYALPATISNCSNNYGPYQFPEKLIPLMIVNALRAMQLPVYGDGKQVRDWLFVEDHCVAIDRILGADVAGRTFNVGGRAEHENVHIVRQLCALVDERIGADRALQERFSECPAARRASCAELIAHVRDRPGHDRRYAIDPSFIASTLRFEPRETLHTGLARTVDWYLTNEAWWSAVMDGSYRQWIDRQYGNSSVGPGAVTIGESRGIPVRE